MADHDFLIWTDIHIHPHKKSEQRLRDCLDTLEWVFRTAKEKNIKNILFGGDFFHDRSKIDLLTCHETFVAMKKYLDGSLNLYMILGNHDLWFYEKSTVSSVTMLSSLPNVVIIDTPKSIIIDDIKWHMIPFTHNPIESMKHLEDDIDSNTYMLGHLAVDGAKLNSSGSVSEVEIEHDGDMCKIDKSLFSKYKYGFLGHYHGYQILSNNLEYIGSPLQLSFGEANETKHILHLKINGDKFSKNYIENTFSPRHYAGTFDEIKSVQKEHLEKAFISLITNSDDKNSIKEEVDLLQEMGIKTVKIKKVTNKNDIENADVVQTSKAILENTETMVSEYVKHIKPDLDYEQLVIIGKSIVSATTMEDE
jgi:DNA repair exonuclease SbcCD nuclease subunit